MLLAAVQLYVLVLRSLDMKYVSFPNVRGHSHNRTTHSLRENDAKFQTHTPSAFHVKIPNLPKNDVYNFRYKASVPFSFFRTSA